MTYHIDTPIPRDGDDGVEGTEIDTCVTGCKSTLCSFDNNEKGIGRSGYRQLTDDTHVGRKVRGTSRSGYCVNKSIGKRVEGKSQLDGGEALTS